MSQRLDRAAAFLLRHVDARADLVSQAALRARIVEALDRPKQRHFGRRVALVLVPIVISVFVVLVALRSTRAPTPIAFSVGTGRVPGSVGSYLVAVEGAALPILFSEGSKVVLSPTAKARISSLSAQGALLYLESGQVGCEIVPRAGAQWVVAAGPFTLEVKGTSFDVRWDSVSGTLEVQMHQGVVRVLGPGVESGLDLRDQQRFVSRSTVVVESPVPAVVRPNTSSTPSSDAVERDAAVVSLPAEPSAATSATPTPSPSTSSVAVDAAAAEPSSSAPPRISWSVLAARGEYAQILTEADARGVDSVLSGGSEVELSALADAARFGGRPGLALQALQALRSRFAGSSRAASAAYLLGRMADDGGNSAAALGWYERYLAEAPGGPLAPEALGRRMLLLRKTGNAAAARKAAETYLQQFPKGPYSGVAREMTTQ